MKFQSQDCASVSCTDPLSAHDVSARVVAVLRALSHPVRLHLFQLIAASEGEVCICRIQDRFDLTQPTLSHHTSVLRQAGLIASRQDGIWVHLRVVPEALRDTIDLLTGLVETVSEPLPS